MWKLTIEDDEGQRTSLELARDEYSIGRADNASIRLTERNVSREHAVFTKLNGQWRVEDGGSYNGTHVNGERITQLTDLVSGAVVQVGDYRIELLDEAAVAAAAEQEWAPEQQRPSRLVMVIGPTPGKEFPLEGEKLTIGRAEEAHVSINHSSVSRAHAELQAVGEGRFEAIDLGSSNGIRINGVELKRGLVGPGDALELGDVRLRFVGLGKWFQPAVDLSQQLPAVVPVAATPEALASEARSNFGKILVVGAVAVILVVVAIVIIGTSGDSEETGPTAEGAPVTTNLAAAKELVAQASEVAETDIEKAHGMLSRIPEGSPVRDSEPFKSIEAKWADAMFKKAEMTKDVKQKRHLLNLISQTSSVDSARRKRAAELVLELGPDPSKPTPPTRPVGHPPATGAVAPKPTDTKATPDPTTTTPTPSATTTASATKTSTPSSTGDDSQFDMDKQRKALEPVVWSGQATPAQIRMLRSICSMQGDIACRNRCTQMLAKKSTPKPPTGSDPYPDD